MSHAGGRCLITAAVEQEIQGIRAAVRGKPEGSDYKASAWSGAWKGNPLLLVRTGVGPSCARDRLAPFLARGRCSSIVSTGYAGGLREAYRLGDILIPDEVQTIPPLPEARFRPDPGLRETLLRAARSGPWQVHTGRMITANRVIVSGDEKHRLGEVYDAESVEMESTIVAELAENRSVPFAVVRVVLDEASFSLPDVLPVFRWWRRREFGKLIAHLALRPHKLLELLKLRQRSCRASRDLTRLFRDYLLDSMFNEGVVQNDKGV